MANRYNQTQIKLNGKALSVPEEFFNISLKASFDSNPQANISTDQLTFNLDSYQEIIKWIENGLKSGVGIFEGIPIQISASGRNKNIAIFEGILDLQNDLRIFPNKGKIRAKLRQDNGLNQLDELIEPLDYGYLLELGVITENDYVDIEYVVVKTDITVEAITLFITGYLLSKQLQDSIKELSTTISTIVGITASGTTGSLGAALYAVAVAIVQAAYAAALLILLIQLGINTFELLISPKRTHKCISLLTLIEKACQHIGYKFNTTIEDLEFIHYLPSNLSVDNRGDTVFIEVPGTIKKGIPNVTDYGYACSEIFQLARELFNARFAILNGVVQFHSENSDFWTRNTEWIKPDAISDIAGKNYRYNTDEIKSSIKISFQTDITDEYTIENYKGTSYQVLTDAKTVNNPKNKTIKNLDIVSVPLALGNRKNKLTGFERLLADIAQLFDDLADVFGGKANLKQKIKNRIGTMKVSNNNHAIPKLIWVEGNQLPSNHRELFSAKALYDKYHVEKSFVANNGARQRVYYEGERIPFGFDDFVAVLNNSYFKDENGKLGKLIELEWNMSNDYAIISYWQQQRYTRNLIETFIEP